MSIHVVVLEILSNYYSEVVTQCCCPTENLHCQIFTFKALTLHLAHVHYDTNEKNGRYGCEVEDAHQDYHQYAFPSSCGIHAINITVIV